MLKQIFKKSCANLKKNWLMSYMLSLIVVLCSMIILSLLFIPLFGDMLMFLIIPFVLVPIIFAMQIMHFGLRENIQPTGKLFFNFFKAYFAPGIMGVYRVINTLLFVMLSQTATALVAYGILSVAMPAQVEEMALILIGEVEGSLTDNLCYSIIGFTAFGVSIMVGFLSSSFNSFSLYFKVKNPTINPMATARMYLISKNEIRGQLIKEYWGLNWPIYVLFALGYAGGLCIAYFSPELEVGFGVIIGLILGLGASWLYLPFFVNNLEEIYLAHHESHFAHAPEAYTEKMQQAMQEQMKTMQEQMDELARQQAQMERQAQEQEDNKNTSANDKKEDKIIDAEVKDDDKDK